MAQQFGSAQPLFSLTKQPQIAIAADLDGLVAHHAYCAFDLTSSPGAPFATFVSNAVALTLLP